MSCTTDTYFVYGIAVTHESLVYAAIAYPYLKGPFRFFHLMRNRARRGVLVGAGDSMAARLPVELWDEIGRELAAKEVRAAKSRFAKEQLSSKHEGCDDYDCCCHDSEITWQGYAVCKVCVGDLTGFEYGTVLTQQCRRLLQLYGLSLPCTVPLATSRDMESLLDPTRDPSSACVVALPSTSYDPAHCSEDDPATSMSIAFVEPEMDSAVRFDEVRDVSLKKPADADARFRRLVHDLLLEPLQISDSKYSLLGTSPKSSEVEGAGRKYKRISRKQVKPRWKLFSVAVWTPRVGLGLRA